MKPSMYAVALIALSSAAFMPAVAMAQIDLNVVIGNAPPPPKYEIVPQARRGYVWAPGFWNWDGGHHVWSAGRWEPERKGSQYRRAEWVRENDNWRLNRGGWVAAEAQPVQTVSYVQVAPPPLRYERMPRARAGYIWDAGHWEWRGQRHAWVPGLWIAERPGYIYSHSNWTQRDGHWYMEQSHWAPRDGGRDRDHDGVPERYEHGRDHDGGHYRDRNHEHDRDGDGVPNRMDHDRDGDGVPNRLDRHPDNPRRD